MSQQQQIGIVRAVFRYFKYWNWRKARGIINAADEQFTGSSDGINAAFDMHQDALVSQYRDLRDAIASGSAFEQRRAQRKQAREAATK